MARYLVIPLAAAVGMRKPSMALVARLAVGLREKSRPQVGPRRLRRRPKDEVEVGRSARPQAALGQLAATIASGKQKGVL
jgi:hypothetical protein